MNESDVFNELMDSSRSNEALLPLFQPKNDAFRERVIQAQVLLGNGPDSVREGLRKLNREMEILIDPELSRDLGKAGLRVERTNAANQYWTNRTGGTVGKDAQYSHLLSRVLTNSEKNNGFTHQEAGVFDSFKKIQTPKVPYMVTVVSSAIFNNQLSNSQHWKDVGVSAAHGEYTHRIQWYLISAAGVPKAGDIMRKLVEFPPTNQGQSALWDAMFDRARYQSTTGLFRGVSLTDFRCPEQFNDYLTSDTTTDFPLLTAFLRARKQKRQAFRLDEYVAMKLFKKSMDDLNESQEKQVRDLCDPLKEQGLVKTKAV